MDPALPLVTAATLEPACRWLPAVRALPRVALTDLPTAAEPLDRLGRAAGIPDLWIKRDDRTGPLYGGNKPRKLELLLGAARAQGRRRVLTFGGIGTHHGLATAVCARAAGVATSLVLIPQPATPHVRACLLALHGLGADLHLARGPVDAARIGLALLARGQLRGERVALVPTGGTSVLGALGYLNAGLELAEQVRAGLLPEPAAIFVALGSGGTVAGLLAGVRLGGLASRLVGVRVSDVLPPAPQRLLRMARACLARFAPDRPVTLVSGDLEVDRRFLGAGYGAVTDDGEAAARLLAEHQGIALETTYTAKCLAALLARAGEPGLRERPLLFWNTFSSVEPALPGGVPPDPATLPREFRRFF